MKKCPFCAEDIQDAAIVCKHCGRDLAPVPRAESPLHIPDEQKAPAPKRRLGCLTLLILAGVFVVIGYLSDSPSTPRLTPEQTAQREEFIKNAERIGLISKWSCIGNEAYVNEAGWEAFNAQAKQGLVLSLASSCDAQDSGNRMTVYGAQSGKKLAEFSGGSYEVY